MADNTATNYTKQAFPHLKCGQIRCMHARPHRPRECGVLKEMGAYPRAKNISDANVFLVIYLHRRNYFDKSLSTMGLRRYDEASNSTIGILPYYGTLARQEC